MIANVPNEDPSFFNFPEGYEQTCAVSQSFWNHRHPKCVPPLRDTNWNRVAMGHVIDFNLARLKRCLPLPDQNKIREARMSCRAARGEGAVRPMRNRVWFSEADDNVHAGPKRWPRDPRL